MSKSIFQIDLIHDATQIAALLNKGSGNDIEFAAALSDIIQGLNGGTVDGSIRSQLGCVYATITGTFTGNPSNNDTMTIGGQAITAVTSGATANQFNIGADATANAAAAAAAINASTTLGTWVVASSAAGVLTVRAQLPGQMGNAITLAESMANFTWAGSATRLASGARGSDTSYVYGRAAEST